MLEHACFFAVGTLYWWHVLSPIRSRKRLTGLGSVAYMTGGKLLVGLLGIVLAFAPDVIYPFYAHKPHYWGLTPLEDQSLAGLVMALEQSIVMGIALVWLFVRMLNESEREQQRAGALRGRLNAVRPAGGRAALMARARLPPWRQLREARLPPRVASGVLALGRTVDRRRLAVVTVRRRGVGDRPRPLALLAADRDGVELRLALDLDRDLDQFRVSWISEAQKFVWCATCVEISAGRGMFVTWNLPCWLTVPGYGAVAPVVRPAH